MIVQCMYSSLSTEYTTSTLNTDYSIHYIHCGVYYVLIYTVVYIMYTVVCIQCTCSVLS